MICVCKARTYLGHLKKIAMGHRIHNYPVEIPEAEMSRASAFVFSRIVEKRNRTSAIEILLGTLKAHPIRIGKQRNWRRVVDVEVTSDGLLVLIFEGQDKPYHFRFDEPIFINKKQT